jgi:hypothetical protein
MVNTRISIFAAVLAVSLSAAQAQEIKPLGLSLRVGNLYPTSNVAQSVGKSWLGFGADFKLKDLRYANASGTSSMLSLSVDSFTKKGQRSLPVNLNYVTRQEKMYYLAGAGVNFAKTLGTSTNSEFTTLSYQVGLGFDITKGNMPYFLELKWMGAADSRLHGWGVFAGVRF